MIATRPVAHGLMTSLALTRRRLPTCRRHLVDFGTILLYGNMGMSPFSAADSHVPSGQMRIEVVVYKSRQYCSISRDLRRRVGLRSTPPVVLLHDAARVAWFSLRGLAPDLGRSSSAVCVTEPVGTPQ
jgi:hypothetical protein